MQIKFSPQRSDVLLSYEFKKEIITATMGNFTDTFDFSNFPDGEAITEQIETTLSINPIKSAKRENGILKIELINYIGSNASEEERFPKWQEV